MSTGNKLFPNVLFCSVHWHCWLGDRKGGFCFLAVLDPMVGRTRNVLSPFISVFCNSNWLFHGESCLRIDVVHLGCVWSSSPACTWHCSLHYLFLQATTLFPHGVTISCLFWQCLTVSSLLQSCYESTRLFSLLYTKPSESFSALSSQRHQDFFLHSFWVFNFHSCTLLQATLAL